MPASTAFETICTPQPVSADAAADHEVSRDLLARVASGELGRALRIWSPVPALALSRLDLLRPGSREAAALAEAAGFQALRRVSGGHAVLLAPTTLCAGFAEPAAAFEGTQERYERLGRAVVDAFAEVGVAAEQGALPGEWCPGAWSIRAGSTKLAGLAQRAVKGGAWVEAVIELRPDAAVRELLTRIYGALELELDPSTFGSASEAAGRAVGFEEIARPLFSDLAPGIDYHC